MKSLQLSYSSAKVLDTCEQKYWHNKVANTPNDSDVEESDAFAFGKAFHEVLEKTLHNTYTESLIMAAMDEHKVGMERLALLRAMLENYTKYHKQSGVTIVKCELKLETPVFVGYIDAIGQSSHGWWIIDLKTASTHEGAKLLARLPRDEQLNLYSYFAEEIGKALKLEGPFLGCRYRQVIKSKAGTQEGLRKGCKVYDIEVPLSTMNPQFAWARHLDKHQRALALHSGEVPKRNYNACMDYHRPCEKFSQCHGEIFSKSWSQCKVHTEDSNKDGDLLG